MPLKPFDHCPNPDCGGLLGNNEQHVLVCSTCHKAPDEKPAGKTPPTPPTETPKRKYHKKHTSGKIRAAELEKMMPVIKETIIACGMEAAIKEYGFSHSWLLRQQKAGRLPRGPKTSPAFPPPPPEKPPADEKPVEGPDYNHIAILETQHNLDVKKQHEMVTEYLLVRAENDKLQTELYQAKKVPAFPSFKWYWWPSVQREWLKTFRCLIHSK